MKTIVFVLLFSLLILTVSSCVANTTMQQPTVEKNPGDILFADDFTVSPNGWGTMDREGGRITFEYSGLVIGVDLTDFMFWTVNGDEFADTRIDVDAVLLDGPTNDNFGVICRYQDDENFYGFLVSHDGYFGIFKKQAGSIVMANASGDLQFSEIIRQGGNVNHISAVCHGSRLKLSVNEAVLAEVEDETFTSGKIGLFAGAYEHPDVEVLFDNLLVTQP